MKLSRLKVENHSRLRDAEIEIRDHLVLVGANDVGKSSLLRLIDLVLGASIAQLYSSITAEDFGGSSDPLIVEIGLVDFSKEEQALFPDEIYVDPSDNSTSLTIQLRVEIDDQDSISIQRFAPLAGTNRQLSRDQIAGLGWKFLSATSQIRDLREDRRTPVDDMLGAIDLGSEQGIFDALTKQLQEKLDSSKLLENLREKLASQLSRALPNTIRTDDLSFVSGAAADEDVLSDVRLQVAKGGTSHNLSEQSDGTRALYAIALYDLMSVGANVVGIDEPEVHLHPTSQRSLARLLRSSSSQKVIATHSSDIVGAFDPDSIVVVRSGGELIQPDAGFMSDDEKTLVRWWVRDRLEPLTSSRVVAVEGISDRILLERVAECTGRSLDRLSVCVLEARGANEMAPIDKLFGESGFNIPMSILIDADAEEATATKLDVTIADLPKHSVWVSRADLEDEYVVALGADTVWNTLKASKLFTPTQLTHCVPTGPGSTYTADDVANFCRRNSDFKVRAALAISPVLTEATSKQIASIDKLLSEIAA